MWDIREVEAWLAAWDSQCMHRTGTSGDDAGADWLIGVAETLGSTVTEQRFVLDRIDPMVASVTVDGTMVDGFGLLDAPVGTADGKAGPIGQGEATIGVGTVGPHAVYSGEFRAMREAAPHAALVLATAGEAPGLALLNAKSFLAPLNAESFLAPYGPPTLLVASEHAPMLTNAARRGATMRMTIRANRRRVEARNVLATGRGSDPEAAPLVVHRAGGRYITLVGSNRLFHLPQDRLPHAVDTQAVARSAAAAARIASALSR